MVACSSCASDAPLVVIVECMSELSRSSEIGLESVLLSCSTYARSSLIVHDSISARGKLAIGCVRSKACGQQVIAVLPPNRSRTACLEMPVVCGFPGESWGCSGDMWRVCSVNVMQCVTTDLVEQARFSDLPSNA